jgi:hypothetical protein
MDSIHPHWIPKSCFWASQTVLLLHEVQCKMCRTCAINVQVHATKSRQKFSQRMHPIHPIGPELIFWGVSDRFVTVRTLVQNRLNWCQYFTSSCNEVMLEFFAMNALDPPHLTPNSCLALFGPFHYCTKQAEIVTLMHKFVQLSHNGIFHNERTRSTLGPQNHVWHISDRAKQGKLVPLMHKFWATKTWQNFLQRMHPILPMRPRTHVFGYLRPFRYCMNYNAKWVELVPLLHKFEQRSHVGIFRNESTRSTTFDPKLIFWRISNRLVTE